VSLPSSYRSRRGHVHLPRVLPLVGCRSKTPTSAGTDDVARALQRRHPRRGMDGVLACRIGAGCGVGSGVSRAAQARKGCRAPRRPARSTPPPCRSGGVPRPACGDNILKAAGHREWCWLVVVGRARPRKLSGERHALELWSSSCACTPR
jgi:hypothetical protein